MEIAELPFWILLVLTLLPITIGILLFIRILDMFKNLLVKVKQKVAVSLRDIGDLLLFLIFMAVLINLILYMIGDQPSTFSIFTYLVEDMLPLTWYTMLAYGILVQLQILLSRRRGAND